MKILYNYLQNNNNTVYGLQIERHCGKNGSLKEGSGYNYLFRAVLSYF